MYMYSLTHLTGRRKIHDRTIVVATAEVNRFTFIVIVISVLASLAPTLLLAALLGPLGVVAVVVPLVFVIAGQYMVDSRIKRGLQLRRYEAMWDRKRAQAGQNQIYICHEPVRATKVITLVPLVLPNLAHSSASSGELFTPSGSAPDEAESHIGIGQAQQPSSLERDRGLFLASKHTLIRFAIGLTLTVAGLFRVGVGRAHADTSTAHQGRSSVSTGLVRADALDDSEGGANATAQSNAWPINRWYLSSAQFHNKFGDFITDDLFSKLQQGSTSGSMLAGNSMWHAGTEITRAAVGFDVIDSAGKTVDDTAAQIGDTVFRQPGVTGLLITAFMGVVLFGALRNRQGAGFGPAIRRIAGAAVVIAVVLAMSAAARNSTEVAGQFKPGTGSPGWVLKTVSDSVNNVAQFPTAVFATCCNKTVGSVSRARLRSLRLGCTRASNTSADLPGPERT